MRTDYNNIGPADTELTDRTAYNNIGPADTELTDGNQDKDSNKFKSLFYWHKRLLTVGRPFFEGELYPKK